MIIIWNGFPQGSNVKVEMKELNSTRDPIQIPVGLSHQLKLLDNPLTLQALKDQNPEESSFKISNLPDNLSIDLSYDAANKKWKMGRGVEFLVKCPTPVNVEIGP